MQFETPDFPPIDINANTGDTFADEIKRLCNTVPKDKQLSAYILENGKKLYITCFRYIEYGIANIELVYESSLATEYSPSLSYLPDIVLLVHVTAVRIYFEYIDIYSKPLQPKFRIGFQLPTE